MNRPALFFCSLNHNSRMPQSFLLRGARHACMTYFFCAPFISLHKAHFCRVQHFPIIFVQICPLRTSFSSLRCEELTSISSSSLPPKFPQKFRNFPLPALSRSGRSSSLLRHMVILQIQIFDLIPYHIGDRTLKLLILLCHNFLHHAL